MGYRRQVYGDGVRDRARTREKDPTLSDDRLKIAVFIDFDNIEIGVKTTLGQHFDVGAVLEAVRERGEIVTKVAYGDWTRAGEYGRAMSQHAIHMVQRNLTPGGDKNGADINLALDALEMAFTHSHINSFVIVGGDSDFISLVEKLKQYDRKVFVVGGRAFTSVVMQKNCTEFVAYENLVSRGRPAPRGSRAASGGDLAQAMPLVRRALKLLADREVLPQLGLLKSTLLQLDSAFSERDYGASSFRDFVQKLANAGLVTLKGSDRSFQVELREGGERDATPAAAPPTVPAAREAAAQVPPGVNGEAGAAAEEAVPEARNNPADILRVFQAAVLQAKSAPRWPLYVRQVKQLVKAVDPQFDERAYGFGGIIDALRFGQRENLFRIERDRLGVVRVFPGAALQKAGTPADAVQEPVEMPGLQAQDAGASGADEPVDGGAVAPGPWAADPQPSPMPAVTAGDVEYAGEVIEAAHEGIVDEAGAAMDASETVLSPAGPTAAPATEPAAPQRARRGRGTAAQPRARKASASEPAARKRAPAQAGRARQRKPQE